MKLRDFALAGALIVSGWCTQQNTKDEVAFAADSRCAEVAALVRNQWSLVIGKMGGRIWVASYVYADGHLIPEIWKKDSELVGNLEKVMQDWDVCKTDGLWNGGSIQTTKFTWTELAAAFVTMIWNNAE